MSEVHSTYNTIILQQTSPDIKREKDNMQNNKKFIQKITWSHTKASQVNW